ncbi:MAG: glycosyltransferase [Nitrosarchaeum sp.]|jgi:UDP-N-acetylglucosamine--N-acetylmuramyl-(pentapeptide) pyrophosphoryl-undecaprenol N-acetylglucosamine transferase|uniref:glycosyltransferase n=1 Tax=Nitrosarchaeum sp. TaxID=2026886 RepID=UPI002DE670CA|nr:glycosyltransferase [Nitrosarchaeum sp.]MEC4847661.1 glycosyltransferase [Nitrosarchaeum sp.]
MIDLDFFSSPIGLGHVTRDIAIANNFENISTKFITGSNAAKILKNLDFKVEDVYIPPSFIIENGKLKNSTRWLWNYYQYYKRCKKISEEIIQKDKPKFIVSDEDFASLTIAQNKKIPTVLITDIVQTNFVNGITSFIEKMMNKSMQKIMKNCDTVIIPENGVDEGNIKRVGPIVRQTRFSRDELRKKFSFDKKTIVISVGGTDAGLYLIEKTIESISKIKKDIDVIVVSGPSLSKEFEETVRNFGFVDNLHEIIFAADVIVSLAGKSTIDESKVYGTPGIFIPIKGHFEQEDNAKEEGFVFEDIYKIDELIIEKLEQKRNPVHSNGAINAYNIIKKLM